MLFFFYTLYLKKKEKKRKHTHTHPHTHIPTHTNTPHPTSYIHNPHTHPQPPTHPYTKTDTDTHTHTHPHIHRNIQSSNVLLKKSKTPKRKTTLLKYSQRKIYLPKNIFLGTWFEQRCEYHMIIGCLKWKYYDLQQKYWVYQKEVNSLKNDSKLKGMKYLVKFFLIR